MDWQQTLSCDQPEFQMARRGIRKLRKGLIDHEDARA